MQRYYTPALYVLSTLNGIISFLVSTSLGASIPEGVLTAAIATLTVATVIPLTRYFADRKLIKLRRDIKGEVLLDETANLVVGDALQRCFVVATKEAMFIISFDRGRPVRLEIKKSSVMKISVTDDVVLVVFLDYGKCIKIVARNSGEMSEILAKQGFGNGK